MTPNHNLIWIDLEMTGLNPDQDTIIEIATLVTDSELKVLAEGPVLAIYQSDDTLKAMDDWNTKQHGKSGLTARVQQSNVSMAQAEADTISFLRKYLKPNQSPMCGNSICQDRRFLAREMPELETFFHYRNLDVSTIKELARRWRPDILSKLKKQGSHLAMDDIKDSIAELEHYREHFFNI